MSEKSKTTGDKKTCFIIMPITTPEATIERYGGAPDHFRHVLEVLFIPAVELAGYTAISPKTKGSDLIHEGIVKNLETADLVLCDLSTLNPNVFWEFGVRTALNKPVVILKDDFTKKDTVPFDISILNYMEYNGSFNSWEIESQRRDIVRHIQETDERSGGKNTLWRVFGLKTVASPSNSLPTEDDRFQLLLPELTSIRRELGEQKSMFLPKFPKPPMDPIDHNVFTERLLDELRKREIQPLKIRSNASNGEVEVQVTPDIYIKHEKTLKNLAGLLFENFGIWVEFLPVRKFPISGESK